MPDIYMDKRKRKATGHGYAPGGAITRVYAIWCNMLSRTTNKNVPASKIYFGKLDDERWRDFRNFIADMGEPPTSKHTLERIDNAKGYSKSNCRWATRYEQMRNTTHNVNLTYNGKTQCVTDWADELGLPRWALAQRIRKGWMVEDALTIPMLNNTTRHLYKVRRNKHE